MTETEQAPESIADYFKQKQEQLLRLAQDAPEDSTEGLSSGPSRESVLNKLTERNYPARHVDFLRSNKLSGPAADASKRILPFGLKQDAMILLCGNRGPGKTQLAVWLAAARGIKSLPVGRYCKLFDLLSEIKTTWAKGGKDIGTETDVLRKYRTSPFLVIDEYQEGSGNSWEDRTLNNILDHRYDDQLATVLIANLKGADAKKLWGPSVLDRAAQTGILLDCDWPSYRTNEAR